MSAIQSQDKGAVPAHRSSPSFLTKLTRIVRAHLTEPQILIEFPLAEIEKRKDALASLRPGYEARFPKTEAELEAWAELLNEEPGFGHWTPTRLRDEILSRLVPGAALTIWHEGKAIACICAVESCERGETLAIGMYLYVKPKYRGRTEVAYATLYGTFYECVKQGYNGVYATTDPNRLSAIALYLSNGCRPVRRELISWYRWHLILKRLGPTLKKMEERKNRAATRRGGDSPAPLPASE